MTARSKIVYKAEPTLRGMRARPAADGEATDPVIHPWDRVVRVGAGSDATWRICGPDGWSRGMPSLRLRDSRASRIAGAAQRRWYRRAWREGRLEIEDDVKSLPWGCSIAMLLLFLPGLALVFVDKILPVFQGFWRGAPDVPMPTTDLIVSRLMAVGMLLFGLALIYGVRIFFLAIRPSKIKSIRIDAEGIRACMRDGRSVFGAWDDCRDIRMSGPCILLDFRSGARVELPPDATPPRISLAIPIIRAELWPERVQTVPRVFAGCLLRASLIWAIMMAMLVGVLYLRNTYRGEPVNWWGIVAFGVMPFVLIGARFLWLRLRLAIGRRLSRRQRRLQRAQRPPAGPTPENAGHDAHN